MSDETMDTRTQQESKLLAQIAQASTPEAVEAARAAAEDHHEMTHHAADARLQALLLSTFQARLAMATNEATVIAIEIEACKANFPSVISAAMEKRRTLLSE